LARKKTDSLAFNKANPFLKSSRLRRHAATALPDGKTKRGASEPALPAEEPERAAAEPGQAPWHRLERRRSEVPEPHKTEPEHSTSAQPEPAHRSERERHKSEPAHSKSEPVHSRTEPVRKERHSRTKRQDHIRSGDGDDDGGGDGIHRNRRSRRIHRSRRQS
jgi:hypothetical protein